MEKIFEVEMVWKETAKVTVKANSKEEAAAIAKKLKRACPSSYVSESSEIHGIKELLDRAEAEDFSMIRNTWIIHSETGNTGKIQVRVDNEYGELKERLMAEDASAVYWNDYRLEGEYEGDFILKSAGLYYSGENDFILIRELNSDELCQFQLAIDLEKSCGSLKG